MSSNRENQDPMELDDDEWGDDDDELCKLTQMMEEKHLASLVAYQGTTASTSAFRYHNSNGVNCLVSSKPSHPVPNPEEEDKLVVQVLELNDKVSQLGNANKNLKDNNYILQGEISTLRRKLEQFTMEKQKVLAEKLSTISQLRSQEDTERKKAISEIDALKSELQFCKNEITQLTMRNKTLQRKSMDPNQSVSNTGQLSQSYHISGSPPVPSSSSPLNQTYHRGPGRQLVAGPPPSSTQSQQFPRRPSKRFPTFYDVISTPVVAPSPNIAARMNVPLAVASPPSPPPQDRTFPIDASIQTSPIPTSTKGIDADFEIEDPEHSESHPFIDIDIDYKVTRIKPKLKDSINKEFTDLLPLTSEVCREHLYALNQGKRSKRLSTGFGFTTLNALAGIVNYMNDRDLETFFPRIEADSESVRCEFAKRREAEEKAIIEEEDWEDDKIIVDFNIPTQHHPYHERKKIQFPVSVADVPALFPPPLEVYPTDFDSENEEDDEDVSEIKDEEPNRRNRDRAEPMEEDVSDNERRLEALPASTSIAAPVPPNLNEFTPDGIQIVELVYQAICQELAKGKMGRALTIIRQQILKLLRHIRGRKKEYLFQEFDRLKLFMFLVVWSSRLLSIHLSRANVKFTPLKGMKKWTKIFLEIVSRRFGILHEFRKIIRSYFFHAMVAISRYGYFHATEFNIDKLTEFIKNAMKYRRVENFDFQIIEIVYNLANEPLLYQKLCLENRRDLYKKGEICLLRIILDLIKIHFYQTPQNDDVQLDMFTRYMELFRSLNDVKRISTFKEEDFETMYNCDTSANSWLSPENWQILTNGVEDTNLCKCRKEFILFGIQNLPIFWRHWEKYEEKALNRKGEDYIVEGQDLCRGLEILDHLTIASLDEQIQLPFRKDFLSTLRLNSCTEISLTKLAQVVKEHDVYREVIPPALNDDGDNDEDDHDDNDDEGDGDGDDDEEWLLSLPTESTESDNPYHSIIQESFQYLVFMYNKCDNICETYGYEIVPEFWVLIGNYVKHFQEVLSEDQLPILQLITFDQNLFSHEPIPMIPEDKTKLNEKIKEFPFLDPEVSIFSTEPQPQSAIDELEPPSPINFNSTSFRTPSHNDWLDEAENELNENEDNFDEHMTI